MVNSVNLKAVRDVVCALYLQRELTIHTADELVRVARSPSKQQAYKMIRAIFPKATPGQSTVYRWLKIFEEAQPSLVAYARNRKSWQRSFQPTVPFAYEGETVPKKTVVNRLTERAEYAREIHTQYEQIIQAIAALPDQLVIEAATANMYLHQGKQDDRT